MNRILLIGGPGAGKTSVMKVLKARGYDTADDNARVIIQERKAAGLSPRPEPIEFARQCLERDVIAWQATTETTFFERGIPDSTGMLLGAGGISQEEALRLIEQYQYHSKVFLFPPWQQIYVTDDERDQTFDEAIDVYDRTKNWYAKFDYQIVEVPTGTVTRRADFLLKHIK